jgi:hypothetical protein
VPGDSNGLSDVFRYDRQTGVTVRVSVSSNGSQLPAHIIPARDVTGWQSGGIRHTAVAVAGDSNGSFDVFLRNVVSGTRVSYPSSATGE